ncbi:hypothetical protein [Oscillibacter sp.]|uniref:hypothetical protein n=1 Tax=Oscillibacter sp. TaxID=1945593 RepID=UPI002D7F9998|nr:hypothetical protein [Oscillibacter sp.]
MEDWKGIEVTAEDLALINERTKAELTAEQLYAFTLRLCDNEVDRDFERFDGEALERLGELLTGKSGIFDHQWSARGQTARLYKTQVVREGGRRTQAGDEYRWLKGWAYLLRTEKNEDLIAEIEGGIKKEVSVGCSAGRTVCSVCGAENGDCGHAPGRVYDGALCFRELRDIADAYEWSFVAVPAQREAGVLKHFGPERERDLLLRKEAELGRKYLKELRREVTRLAMLADDGLDGGIFARAAERLEEPELLELRKSFEERAAKRFPVPAQLRRRDAAKAEDAEAFLV